MSTKQQDANAEASITIPPSNEPANQSYTDLARTRALNRAPPEEEAQPEATEKETEEKVVETEEAGELEATEETTESEGIAEESEAAGLSEDVLSNIDLSKLSPEDIDKLREVTQSRAVERYGELTASRKAAEERAAVAEARLRDLTQAKNPLETDKPVENNPFADIDTIEELQKQYASFEQIEEWAEEVLEENEHASYDDIISEQDGKDITKRQVKEYLKRAKQSQKKFLPARAQELQMAVQAEQVKTQFEQQAKADLKWLGDTESDVNVQYEQMIKDPRVQEIAEKVPAVAPQLRFLLAHAANSMLAMKQTKPAAKKGVSLQPPSNPSSSAGASNKPSDRINKQLKNAESRFKESGTTRDFVDLRTAQLAKRYK